eukprot:scaffold192424_cov33-Tisochrysis_lutea.AAC.2
MRIEQPPNCLGSCWRCWRCRRPGPRDSGSMFQMKEWEAFPAAGWHTKCNSRLFPAMVPGIRSSLVRRHLATGRTRRRREHQASCPSAAETVEPVPIPTTSRQAHSLAQPPVKHPTCLHWSVNGLRLEAPPRFLQLMAPTEARHARTTRLIDAGALALHAVGCGCVPCRRPSAPAGEVGLRAERGAA